LDDLTIEIDQEALSHYSRLSTRVKKDIIEQLGLEIEPENDILYFNNTVSEELDNIKNSLYGFWLDVRYHLPDIYVFIFYILFTLYNGFYISNLYEGFITMDLAKIQTHPVILIGSTLLPYAVWLCQSNREFWNFYKRKKALLLYLVVITVIKFNALIFTLVYVLLIPSLAEMKIGGDITPSLILEFSYVVHGFVMATSTALLIKLLHNIYVKGGLGPKIEAFKLRHHMEFYFGKYKYDLAIVKDMNTGKPILIKEKDRGLHSEALGASGTGKTSAVILRMVERDLEKRRFISNILKKKLYTMIVKGQAYINEEFEDGKFAPNYFTPNKGYEKKFERLKRKYRLMGITVVAPDTSTTNAVRKLAQCRGVSVNACDPVPDPDTGKLKNGFVGVNVLSVKEGLKGWEYDTALCKNSTVLADLMQKRFESSGKTDPYFSSINRIATTTLAILLMHTYKILHNGKKPTVDDVAYLLNDFGRIPPYLKELKKLNKDDKYQTYIDILENEFTSDRFKDHSTGLRVQFNSLLENTLLKNILCYQDSIDFDRILENSEITICNTSLAKLGDINSSTLGLIFTNSIVEATLNRPYESSGKYIAPHVLAIDEFPKIATPLFESCFTLFRKYWVFMFIALQTFDQMNKEEFLKYLRGIILNSCGHHFVFGRANFSDMQEFSRLAGEEDVSFVEVRETTNSLLDKNPTFSESLTEKTESKPLLSASSVTNKDFLEISLFTVRNNSPINGRGIHAKVSFLKPSAWVKKRFISNDWSEAMKSQTIIDTPTADIEKNSEKDKERLNETLPEKVTLNKVSETTIENTKKSPTTGDILLKQKTYKKTDPVLSSQADETIDTSLLSTTNIMKGKVNDSSCSQEIHKSDPPSGEEQVLEKERDGKAENYILIDDHTKITDDVAPPAVKTNSITAVHDDVAAAHDTRSENEEKEGEKEVYFKIIKEEEEKEGEKGNNSQEGNELPTEVIEEDDVVITLDDIIE